MLEASKMPNEADVTEELQTNGRLLVETLKSFGVQTKIVDICRGALINLLVNVFMGLSIGANVLTARYVGAKDDRELSDTVHTAILLSLVSAAE